ncbi:MAG: DUF1294 domain-containing protein [Boseongicola sp.]
MIPFDFTLLLISYLVIVNVLTFLAAGYDKLAAMNFWQRAPEWLLLGLSVFGGAPTAKLIQIATGHKTLRQDFTLNLNLIAVFHLTLGIAAWSATSPYLERLELSQMARTASAESEMEARELPNRFGPGS